MSSGEESFNCNAQPNITPENIQYLNNDCLSHIFVFLPMEDKLKFEMVCTRWKRVAEISWCKVNSLKISKSYYSFVSIQNDRDRNINFFTNVLKRCGPYINDLFITNSIFGIRELILEIIKYCTKLQKLCFFDKYGNGHFYDDEDLRLLFERSVYLRSISLLNIVVRGYCLENLLVAPLEELEILKCKITLEEHFYNLLSNIRCLKKLKILCYVVDSERIFSALNVSNCTSICDFSLLSIRGVTIDYNIEFIRKQKNLRRISLQNVLVTREIIESLPKSTLEEIKYLKCNYELISSLNKFPNLHTLILYFRNNDFKTLTAKYFKIISQVIDVRFIKFSKCFCVISNNKAGFSKTLKNFTIDHVLNRYSLGVSTNIDKLLNIIRPCKNLETLYVGDCNCTGLGITYINKLLNLKTLNISLNDKIADAWLILIIKKLLKLEKLFVFHCPLITNNSIKQANEIKKKRNDVKKLEVFYYGSKITKNAIENDIDNCMVLLNDTSRNLRI